MTLFLIRHAKAGSRSDWDDDDRLRPLSNKGRVQADQLAVVLAAVAPSRLVSSPYLRCVQTLEPLGRLCDLEVVADERLAEDGPFEAVLELLADLPRTRRCCAATAI
ncbi:MAG: phosphoglycerate mutase family protein [Ilumatobacteraceae bacterium]